MERQKGEDQSPRSNLFFVWCQFKKAEVCSCPSTLAAETVANLIGKLCSLFVESGRGREWNGLLGIGSSTSHHSVKQYLVLNLKRRLVLELPLNRLSLCFSINFYAYAPF